MWIRPAMAEVGAQEANLYLVADPTSRDAALIDAGAFVPPLVEWAAQRGLAIRAILITHLHHDHVEALPRYMAQWPGAAVIAPAPLASASAARLVAHGDRLACGTLAFEVLAVPGHTPESVAYACPAEAVCFTGDALFAGSVGGTEDDARFEQLIDALRRHVLTLPPRTRLYPGHGPATTVAIERAANPFFQPGFGRAG